MMWLTPRKVVDDAEAQYLAFFAGKTVGMIRAPDCKLFYTNALLELMSLQAYVYPSPFNLIEVFFVIPFEYVRQVG